MTPDPKSPVWTQEELDAVDAEAERLAALIKPAPAGGELGERLLYEAEKFEQAAVRASELRLQWAQNMREANARIAALEDDLKTSMQVNDALARQWKRATALNEETKLVLEPFARHADLWIEMGDTRPITISDGHTLFVRDLRAAAALLKKIGETG